MKKRKKYGKVYASVSVGLKSLFYSLSFPVYLKFMYPFNNHFNKITPTECTEPDKGENRQNPDVKCLVIKINNDINFLCLPGTSKDSS